MNKRSFLIYMMFVLCFFVVGCGGDKKKKETTEAPATTQAAVVTTEEEQVRKDEDGFILANDYIKTKGETINVRVQPSTDANIYILLGNDEVLRRTGYNDEWTRVSIDNDSFYIYSEFVVKTNTPVGLEDEVSMATPGDSTKQVIVIDPGNQKNLNATMEEIGPGSDETKQSASSGFVGAKYGSREYELNLSIAYELKYELELRGYKVIMTREMDDVNISNMARAEIANDANASAFIRIQANYSSNEELSGVMAICMPENSIYNGHLYSQSHNLSTRVLQGITEKVDVVNNGIYETNQMTAVNWSRVPVTVVKVGYLSNATDEELLMSYDYQSSIAVGIADGIDYYFGN